jgi:3-deoxy-D-manno-octulosonate 8-phosphate phosphatase (KDO 8-P phosphatase)
MKNNQKKSVVPVTKSEQQGRASHIRLLLADCDGVLTDNGVYYSDLGEEMKRYSIRDGMGVALLRNAGIETGIISGEASRSLQQRAEKLRITHLYLGVTDKLQQVKALANHHNIPLDAIAYIGDDVNDTDVLSELHNISLTAVPADAISSVHPHAHYICTATGGHGAFREFSDWILDLRCTGNVQAKHKEKNR